jgi:hypothetical protein
MAGIEGFPPLPQPVVDIEAEALLAPLPNPAASLLAKISELKGTNNEFIDANDLVQNREFKDDINSVLGLQALAASKGMDLTKLTISEAKIPQKGEIKDGVQFELYDSLHDPNSKFLRIKVEWTITDGEQTATVSQWIYTATEVSPKDRLNGTGLDRKKLEALYGVAAYVEAVKKSNEFSKKGPGTGEHQYYTQIISLNTLQYTINYGKGEKNVWHPILGDRKIESVSVLGLSLFSAEAEKAHNVGVRALNAPPLSAYMLKNARKIGIDVFNLQEIAAMEEQSYDSAAQLKEEIKKNQLTESQYKVRLRDRLRNAGAEIRRTIDKFKKDHQIKKDKELKDNEEFQEQLAQLDKDYHLSTLQKQYALLQRSGFSRLSNWDFDMPQLKRFMQLNVREYNIQFEEDAEEELLPLKFQKNQNDEPLPPLPL